MRKNCKKYIFILQFTDSGSFMVSSLSNLVNELSEEIHRINCKYGHDDKKCETCGTKFKYCECFLGYTNFKDDLIEHKCLLCNKNCQIKFDKKFKERFFYPCKYSNHDEYMFSLLLQRVAYPYEYMDDWEKFNETSSPEKKYFYRHLNVEDIIDAVYVDA